MIQCLSTLLGVTNLQMRACWEVSQLHCWCIIILIVPNRLVKQLLHSVKVAVEKALKRLIEGILG